MQSVEDDDPRYAEAVLVRLEEMALTRRIQELKSRLQRLNPVEQAAEYNRMFGELIMLEQQKRAFRDKGIASDL
jgi:DNA primase